MQRNPIIQTAHDHLQNPSKAYVTDLLSSVNLTRQEQSIVEHSELYGDRISEIAMQMNLSVESIMRIKTKAMLKIGRYALSLQ